MDHRSSFVDRHIGPNQYQIQTMLLELGFKDLDSFIKAVVPANIHIKGEIEEALPQALSEAEALAEIKAIASQNKVMKNFIGNGYYGTITPAVILRNVLENPGWYTAYTPYQPEISQGRLEAIFAFQTAVTDLTGLAIANASMLDEATAAAEAADVSKLLIIRATGDSWVEVTNGTGVVVIQRMLKSGDVVDFSAAPPYAVVVGRVDNAEVVVRGRAFDTTSFARNGVARFEVK